MKQLLLYTSTLLMRGIFRFFFKLEITGNARRSQYGRLILASNHQSNWDPFLVGVAARREVFFVAKKQLFSPFPVKVLLNLLNAIPLDRRGFDRKNLRRMEGILDQGGVLVMFPEGTRSTTGELGKVRDGVGMLALQTQADVQPVYLEGTRNTRPRIWRRHRLYLRFGEIIPITTFLKSEEPRRQLIHRLSEEVMAGIRVMQATAIKADEM